MWCFPFLGNGHPLYTPSSAAVLLFFEGLVETTIPGDLSGCFPEVLFDFGHNRTQRLHIGHAVLILHMGKNQSIVILGEGDNGAKLTVGTTLPLFDDGDIRLIKRIDPIPGEFAGEKLFRLIDDFSLKSDAGDRHPSDRFPLVTHGTVIYRQGIVETVLVNQAGGAE